jgi:hypothetical protein
MTKSQLVLQAVLFTLALLFFSIAFFQMIEGIEDLRERVEELERRQETEK